MSLNLGLGTPEYPIPSASVLMLRDGPVGVEVLLLKRNGLADVLGGAYVFPGGKLDLTDAGLVDRLDQPLLNTWEMLGEGQLSKVEAGALYVAAIREVFEEASVLFAPVDQAKLESILREYRTGQSFAEVISGFNVIMQSSRLQPWSRWITPRGSVRARKHFDARFFVALGPEGQVPVHDSKEAVESVWLRPVAALKEYLAHHIELAPPQIMSLLQLAHYKTTADVFAYACCRTPPCIQPEVFEEDGSSFVCFPGDLRHSSSSVEVPGPTRLIWRTSRYEPLCGLDNFLR